MNKNENELTGTGSNRKQELLPALLGNYDRQRPFHRPTNRPTNRQAWATIYLNNACWSCVSGWCRIACTAQQSIEGEPPVWINPDQFKIGRQKSAPRSNLYCKFKVKPRQSLGTLILSFPQFGVYVFSSSLTFFVCDMRFFWHKINLQIDVE